LDLYIAKRSQENLAVNESLLEKSPDTEKGILFYFY